MIISIHLKIDVYIILKLQKYLIKKELIYHFLMKPWVCMNLIKNNQLLGEKVLYLIK